MKLKIKEQDLGLGIWGLEINITIRDKDDELRILEFASKHIKREHKIEKNGKEVKKTIAGRIKELKKKKGDGK